MSDGPSVFLVPSSGRAAVENFRRTVIEGVPRETIRDHDGVPFASDRLAVWGTREGNVSTWKQLREGDYLLFYQERHYPYAARILTTEENEPLGETLWPDHEEGDPWKYIMYLLDVVETDVSKDEINDFAGYSDGFAPRGFQSVRESAVEAIVEEYGSVWEFVHRRTGRDRSVVDRFDSDIDVRSQPEVELPASILDGLYFPNRAGTDILDQVSAALNAGKHLIFTGPPGTGKTEIAERVSRHLVDSNPGIYTGYEVTTATADWSTFETVGGYMPLEGEADGETLAFEPGQVLRRFKRNNRQRNELLVIDEINRADIDKSFGQLFTLLSGQGVQLPYKRNGLEIVVHPSRTFDGSPRGHEYVMPESWRILATMNSYDKTSLYEMSYAFMRRFAFVHVDAPEIPDDPTERASLVRRYADAWNVDTRADVVDGVGAIWAATNDSATDRKIGPAIVEDMLRQVNGAPEEELRRSITQAVTNYVFPQLEGVPERRRIVSRIANTEYVDRDRLWQLAGDVLRVAPDE